MTTERNEFQTGYNFLIKETDELKKQKDVFQKKLTDLGEYMLKDGQWLKQIHGHKLLRKSSELAHLIIHDVWLVYSLVYLLMSI